MVNRLGFPIQQGMGNSPEDIRKWEVQAQAGDLDAKHLLALALRSGDGMAMAKDRGFDLLMEASDQGHMHAPASIGVAYYFGDGVPKNHQLAMKWYQAGAVAGSDYAIFNIADLFDDSDEITKNPPEAMAWFVCCLQDMPLAAERMRKIAPLLSEEGLDLAAQRAVQIQQALKQRQSLDLKGDFKPVPPESSELRDAQRSPVSLISFLLRFHLYSHSDYSEWALRTEVIEGESLIYLPAAETPDGVDAATPGQMRLACLGKDEKGNETLFAYDDAWHAKEKFEREKSYAVSSHTLVELIMKLKVKRLGLNAGLQDSCVLWLPAPAPEVVPEPVKVNYEDPEGYYALLGVSPAATGLTIMQKYQAYQEKNAHDHLALQRGAAAFAVLGDYLKRHTYDANQSERTRVQAKNNRRIEDARLMAMNNPSTDFEAMRSIQSQSAYDAFKAQEQRVSWQEIVLVLLGAAALFWWLA